MYTFFPQMKYMVFSAASTSPPAFERSLLEADRFAKNGLLGQQMCPLFASARQRREAER